MITLERAIKARNKTQIGVARELGWHQATLNKYVNSERKIPTAKALALAKILRAQVTLGKYGEILFTLKNGK